MRCRRFRFAPSAPGYATVFKGGRSRDLQEGVVMSAAAKIAAGVASGYLLGRTKKLKLAITVGSMLAGKRIATDPRALMKQLMEVIENNPELSKLSDQVRNELYESARAAAIATAGSRMDRFSDAIHDRSQRLALPGSEEESEEGGEYEEEPGGEYDEEDYAEEPEGEESQGEESQGEDEPEEEPEPRRTAKRSQSTARRATKQAGPAKKSASKKSAPAKRSASKQTAAASKSTSKQTSSSQTAKKSGGGQRSSGPAKKSASKKSAPAKKSASKSAAKKTSTAKKSAAKKSSSSGRSGGSSNRKA